MIVKCYKCGADTPRVKKQIVPPVCFDCKMLQKRAGAKRQAERLKLLKKTN